MNEIFKHMKPRENLKNLLSSPKTMKTITHLVKQHDRWREKTLNLLASENVLSPGVREVLGSDLSSRYSLEIHDKVHGEYVDNAYCGTRFSEEIIHSAEKTACEVFNSKFAITDCLSGHIAAMNVVLSTMKKGEKLMYVPIESGGYDGYGQDYFPDMFGFRSVPLPSDKENWNISEKAGNEIIREKPALVVLGASFILFPYKLKPLRKACSEVGAKLVFDASHVLGLLAGKEFQPDAVEMCDIVYGSTHKSFFGPQGGLIVTNDEELHNRMRRNLTWRTIDNPHLNRIAGLGVALEEMKIHGRDYASKVVRNSQALGKALFEIGIPVKFPPGFSKSHQLHVNPEKVREKFGLTLMEIGKLLENHSIVIDAVGRFGTAEVTRLGMNEKNMKTIAELIKQILTKVKNGKTEADIRNQVEQFRKSFDLNYTIDD